MNRLHIRFFFHLLLVCVSLNLLSQKKSAFDSKSIKQLFQPIDSLLKVDYDAAMQTFNQRMSQLEEPREQLYLYEQLISKFAQRFSTDSTLKYIEKALELPAEDSASFRHLGYILKIKAQTYRKSANYEQSIVVADTMMARARRFNHYRHEISAHIEKAAIFDQMSDHRISLELLTDAIDIANENEDWEYVATLNSKLASTYTNVKDHERAIPYFKKALRYFIANEKLNRIAKTGSYISLSWIGLKAYDSAAYYLDLGMEAAVKMENPFGINIIRLNQAVNAYHIKNYEEALVLLDSSQAFFIENNDRYGQMICDYNYCRIHYTLGNTQKALKYGQVAYQTAVEIKQLPYFTELIEFYIKSLVANGDRETASVMLDTLVSVMKAKSESEKDRETGRLLSRADLKTTRYENNLLTTQNQLQEQEIKTNRIILVTISGALIIGILLLAIIFRVNRNLKKSNQIIEAQADKLKEMDESKSRWFVNIAHELKTPITLVKGPIGKILNQEQLSPVVREDLLLAYRNVNQLNELTHEILELSRMESEELKLDNKPFDFSAMLKSSIAAFESLAQTNRVALKHQVSDTIFLKADENKLRKLFQNLLSNALKFTHEGEKIDLSLEKNPEYIVVRVVDTGEGIPADDLPYIFDRFFQTSKKGLSHQGGTGVGLAFAKQIAEMLGGTIEVKSTVGEGSTFMVKLPTMLVTDAEQTSIDTDDEEVIKEVYEAPKLTNLPSVLVVEDNADMRKFIESILRHDFRLILARDGVDALEKLKQHKVDLVISDVMMPRMDGLQLITELKKNEQWNQLPVIVLTALSGEEERLITLRTGIDDYLSKPFNADELSIRALNLLKNAAVRVQEPEEEQAYDNKFINDLIKLVDADLTTSKLSVTYLADEVAMSERNLRRYLKKHTGLSPAEFITERKLTHALVALEKRTYATIKEVSNACGFTRADRFSKSFYERFGKRPADYL